MTPQHHKDRVIIIGGGIQGCAAAYFLAKRGQTVTLLEKDNIARHASGVNAGGVRRLGRDLAEIPLSLAAMDIWNHLSDEIGDAAMAFHPSFYVKVAIDEPGHIAGMARAEALQQAGFQHEVWLDETEIRKRIPCLARNISAKNMAGGEISGGLVVEGDGWAIPWRIVRGFADAAVRNGATITEHCHVESLKRQNDVWQIHTNAGDFEADIVVNCAGAWAADLARQSGEPDLPLTAYAPMLAVTERRPQILNAVMGILGHTLSLKQLDTGQFVIGGGVRADADIHQNEAGLSIPELATSMYRAAQLFPDIAHAKIIRCWSGIEGYMPDNLPVIGRGNQDGLVHGFGFSAHGFQLGPAVGEALADLVMGQQPRTSLAAFSPQRFSA
tara:strand:- start:93 stop:1247 length:1155 start_codon:yes stop_codon:yes gene_type:complete